MDGLKEGVIQVLLLAEWPGMDHWNVHDLERVVQVKRPKNIWTLGRRFESVARDPSVSGVGIVMAQP